MIERITILHEYGPKRHYEALFHLKERDLLKKINIVKFSIPYLFLYEFRSIPKELVGLSKLLLHANDNIVVGAAPYDAIVTYLLQLKKKNNLIYHTSWPFWDKDIGPKKSILLGIKRLWKEFLRDLMVVTVTKYAKHSLEKIGINAFHIPHSVNTEIFKPLEATKSNNKVHILYVGRLVPEKGIGYLIKVITGMQWKNTEFWFVGDGKLRSFIEALEQKYPVKYFGYIDDQKILAKIYQSADILVLPTISEELFGIVLIEAMACGLPTIATNTIGPMEIVKNGTTGIVIPKGDIKALKNSIEMLIQDEALRKKMGTNGREEAIKKYDVAVVSKQWMKVIEKVLK
ncbi:MAG: glycosyltransferase family 4 protein [Nitrososphaeria archaeon]